MRRFLSVVKGSRGGGVYTALMTHLDRARAFLRALETRDGSALSFYAPDVVLRMLPNRLVPDGAVCDLGAIREAGERGKQATEDERYDVAFALEAGDTVALEVEWSAAVRIPFGKLAAGERMRAHFAMFLTFR